MIPNSGECQDIQSCNQAFEEILKICMKHLRRLGVPLILFLILVVQDAIERSTTIAVTNWRTLTVKEFRS